MTDSDVTLRLPEHFVGQLVDCLDDLIDQWETTARYHESGYCDNDVLIRECTDEREARKMLAYLTSIKVSIEAQLEAAR